MVEIDATNSQMVFLAKLAVDELGTDDAREFAEVCYAGRFYEESFLTVHGRYPTRDERSAWKGSVMGAWLYGKMNAQQFSKTGVALAARWPSVHEMIFQTKKDHDTAELPCRMQKLEAALWIDQLVPALAAAKVPCLTVHDCVLVPASKASTARQIIEGIYANAGMTAQFGQKLITKPIQPVALAA